MTDWLGVPFDVLLGCAKAVAVVGALLTVVPAMVWVERRGGALMQDRLGPNRVGWFGILQPVADALKFMRKEDVIPDEVDRFLFVLAPCLTLLPAFATFAVIPFGPSFEMDLFGQTRTITLQVANVDIGLLVILALLATGVYGIVLAGWSSNNKYSLRGGIRATAQIISYEIAMSLAIIAVIIPAASLRLPEIALFQKHTTWFLWTQPIGAMVFFIASYAETNRLPFDLPEAEAELVGGYHTEYSSMKFALFFMAEYTYMVTAAGLFATLYLGGWTLPFFAPEGLLGVALGVTAFATKVAFLLWVFVWIRWTLPRYRYDQLMHLGWKVLIPLGVLNILYVAIVTVLGPSIGLNWFN